MPSIETMKNNVFAAGQYVYDKASYAASFVYNWAPSAIHTTSTYKGLELGAKSLMQVAGYTVEAVLPVLKIPANASAQGIAKIKAAHEIAVKAAYEAAAKATEEAFGQRVSDFLPVKPVQYLLNITSTIAYSAQSALSYLNNLYLAQTLAVKVSLPVALVAASAYGTYATVQHYKGLNDEGKANFFKPARQAGLEMFKFAKNTALSAALFTAGSYLVQGYAYLLKASNFDKHMQMWSKALSTNTYVSAVMPYITSAANFVAPYYNATKGFVTHYGSVVAQAVSSSAQTVMHYAGVMAKECMDAVNYLGQTKVVQFLSNAAKGAYNFLTASRATQVSLATVAVAGTAYVTAKKLGYKPAEKVTQLWQKAKELTGLQSGNDIAPGQ